MQKVHTAFNNVQALWQCFLQELTAAQKKKLKKKAKEKAKKADDKEGTGKKGPAKKESAAVRKLREDLERQKAEQEAAQKAEEERIRQVIQNAPNAAACLASWCFKKFREGLENLAFQTADIHSCKLKKIAQ